MPEKIDMSKEIGLTNEINPPDETGKKVLVKKGKFVETLETIRSILKDKLDIDPESVTQDSTFESLGIDSLDMVELICELEDVCNIDFGEPEGLSSVGDLIDYIDSL